MLEILNIILAFVAISYSLFETKNIHQRSHRDWDQHWEEINRYWYNIPALYIINSLLYKEFQMNIYVSNTIKNHKLYDLLEELNKEDNFNLIEVDKEYSNTEPTMWRMIPFWEKDIDIILCRDLDSLPTISEVKTTKQFIASKFSIHNIRSHNNHNNIETMMMAKWTAIKNP